MTTTIPFSPSPTAAFQTNVTLDGIQWGMVVGWNVYRQDWYITLRSLGGVRAVTLPLIGSPPPRLIASMAWSQSGIGASVEVQTVVKLPQKLGSLYRLVVAGCTPAGYNGTFLCPVDGPNSFSYPLSADPGVPTILGTYSPDINIVGGYFVNSTLIWRPSAGWFEVNP